MELGKGRKKNPANHYANKRDQRRIADVIAL